VIPARLNFAIALGIVVANVAALFFAASAPMLAKAAMAIAIILSTPAHWALVHEAIHGHLFASRRANDIGGRLLAILFGLPFAAARFAHLRHHRYNRLPPAREEVFDETAQSRIGAYAFHYFRIAYGLYAGELAINALCFLPRAMLRRHLQSLCPATDGVDYARAIQRTMQTLGQIRIDAFCVIALFSAAIYADSGVLIAIIIGRGFIISQLDHAPHHGTPLDNRDYALNMTAPRWLRGALLNFNFHRNHHRQPQLPWKSLALPQSFANDDISFARAVLRQWRGPIAASDERIRARAT